MVNMNYYKMAVGLLISIIVGIAFSTGGFATVKNTQLEIKQNQKYVNQLNNKIKKLSKKPTAKNKQKITKLKKEKQAALQRIQTLKAASQANSEEPEYEELVVGEVEIMPSAPLQPSVKQAVPNTLGAGEGVARRQISLGMLGGAGVINLGYNFPLGPVNELRVEAGYGLGNQYSIIDAGISAVIPIRAQYVGLRLGVTNYSVAVSDIPGISGTVPQGSTIGGGVFGGMKILGFNAEVGYSTDYGFSVSLAKRF